MKAKDLILSSLFAMALPSYAETVEIVGDEACSKSGRNLQQCEYSPLDIVASIDKEYVNKYFSVNIVKSGNCSTAYPISLNVGMQGGESRSINALRSGGYTFPQSQLGIVQVVVNAPYKRFAQFKSSCSITAEVDVDIVDVSALAEDLGILKAGAESEISEINDRITDKETIVNLIGIANSLEQLINISQEDFVSFYALDDILQDNCDGISACTWSSQMEVVLAEVALPFSQFFLLFNLATALDSLIPSDCADGNCVATLVDGEVLSVLNDVRAQVSEDDLAKEIEELIGRKLDLTELLSEYRQVATDYSINWNDL